MIIGDDRIRPPLAAMVLGAAGLIPFLWGVIALQTGLFTPNSLSVRPAIEVYGLMIFSYMAGCFWPFAARLNGARDYLLAVAPVLVLIAMIVPDFVTLNQALILGFAGLLPIDWYFTRAGAAPTWWMRLRVPLSAVVIASLIAILLTASPA
ncbi:DUF3429 domain-containing protein [Paracoccus sp. TK19116]|uniref:DUF3429 domain-containing protein n=1 Tax=Paracoccus albicereus TaxID=2922394 RepID=A0ABT1MV53_9RHOB|nr:DUF3429 domain-containing protein [Paracoccus albicereus]MCQ0970741.1 DUF3429 domain-containing protein [Paracoccus albicereus]